MQSVRTALQALSTTTSTAEDEVKQLQQVLKLQQEENIPIPYRNNLGSLSIKFYKGKLYRLRSDRVTLDIFDSQYNLLETITVNIFS